MRFLLVFFLTLFTAQGAAWAVQPGEAADLIFPLEIGSDLPEGYRITGISAPTDSSIRIELTGEDGKINVVFYKRDDASPAFMRTPHCNVIYELEQPSGSRTPEKLFRVISILVIVATPRDRICEAMTATSIARPYYWRFPWHMILLIGLVFALVGLGAHHLAPRLRPWQKEVLFISGVAALTIVGMLLRIKGIDLPFFRSGATWRIQLAASSLPDLVLMNAVDNRNPPLTVILLHFLIGPGSNEALFRAPFVLSSVFSLPLTAVLARRVGGGLAGVGACFICAVALPLVDVGTQIRSHALFFLLSPAVLLLHLKLRREPGTRNWILLGAFTGLALWAHYFSAILLVVQLLDWLAARFRRTGAAFRGSLARALITGAALGFYPLLFMIRGAWIDRGMRGIAERSSGALWGASGVGEVFSSARHFTGDHFFIMLLVFAAIGSTEVILRSMTSRREAVPFELWIAVTGWAAALAVLILTPLLRMRGIYFTLAMPMLILTAMAGAVRVPAFCCRRILKENRSQKAAGALAWGLAAVLASTAAFAGFYSGAEGLVQQRSGSCAAEIARIIRAGETSDVVLLYEYSQTLLGYYLADEVKRPSEVKKGPRQWLYGDVRIHSLCSTADLDKDWRALAKTRLAAVVAEKKKVWLVVFRNDREKWDGMLEPAGCRLHASFEDAWLYGCGKGGP